MPTPLLNLAVAKTLLEKDRSPEAVEQVYDLVSKAVKQQKKSPSQRLESDPALCQSSQYKPPRGRSPLDVGSQTGSSERRRRDARQEGCYPHILRPRRKGTTLSPIATAPIPPTSQRLQDSPSCGYAPT